MCLVSAKRKVLGLSSRKYGFFNSFGTLKYKIENEVFFRSCTIISYELRFGYYFRSCSDLPEICSFKNSSFHAYCRFMRLFSRSCLKCIWSTKFVSTVNKMTHKNADLFLKRYLILDLWSLTNSFKNKISVYLIGAS